MSRMRGSSQALVLSFFAALSATMSFTAQAHNYIDYPKKYAELENGEHIYATKYCERESVSVTDIHAFLKEARVRTKDDKFPRRISLCRYSGMIMFHGLLWDFELTASGLMTLDNDGALPDELVLTCYDCVDMVDDPISNNLSD